MLRIVLLSVWLALASTAALAREVVASAKVTRAAELMKSWQGDSRKLDEARVILARELKDHPDSAAALREQARLLMLTGYVSGTTYTAGSLAAATKTLDQALAIAPDDPDSLVLRAYIYANQQRLDDGWAALEVARQAGLGKHELLLAQSMLLRRQQRYAESAAAMDTLLKLAGTTPSQRLAARVAIVESLMDDEKPDEADRVYQEQLKDTPDDAWTHGNYASFLLCSRDDAESSLAHARKARGLLDYGKAQQLEVAALFRLWAQQTLDDQPKDAEKSWKQTGAAPQANIVPVITDRCGDNRVVYALLKAMLKTGYGARIPALLAPIAAAEAAPDKVAGVFVLKVQATGRGEGMVYLNSETDYRDPRNVTVRILPAAQEQLRKQYGDNFEAALKGKPIEVMGFVERVKVVFTANGVATDKFYYQTHIVMFTADQLLRLEDRPATPEPHDKLDNEDFKT